MHHAITLPNVVPLPETSAPIPRITRFTLDGSDEMETQLDTACQQVLVTVLDLFPEKKLDAILMGGSYGRGEGAVYRTTAGDQPYDDLEYYVCLRGSQLWNQQRYQMALQAASEELSARTQMNVRLRALSLRSLRRSPITLDSYNLFTGHRWLRGNDNLLRGCEQHRDATHVPLSEATRLLLNACSHLLIAKEYVEHELMAVENMDYISRTLAKVRRALGDAVLTVYGRYHWDCRERRRRLKQFSPNRDLPWLQDIQRHHHEGVNYALHPDPAQTVGEAAKVLHGELTALALRLWLWLESRRLGQPFTSARDYAFSPVNRCPENKPWENYAANVWQFGGEMIFNPASLRHPRERLMRALTLMLWEPAFLKEPAFLRVVQRDIQTYAATFDGLLTSYQRFWDRFDRNA